jgi:hypothetical protein
MTRPWKTSFVNTSKAIGSQTHLKFCFRIEPEIARGHAPTGADRIEACLEEARDSRERCRAPCLSSRPCDRAGRGRGAVNRSAAAASTRRHQDYVEIIQPRDPGIATSGYGADRWIRIPIITILGIITEVRA